MTSNAAIAFISYSRADSEFALRLAGDLKAAGANVWLDQLDIEPGTHWDTAVEEALLNSAHLLVLLSSVSVTSDNVRDEVSYALSQRMKIIPVLVSDCTVPFRLARYQHIDFRKDYSAALKSLRRTLHVAQMDTPAPVVWRTTPGSISASAERKRRVEAAQQQVEREQQLAEQAKLKEVSEKPEATLPAAEAATPGPATPTPAAPSPATPEQPQQECAQEQQKDLSESEVEWLSLKPAKDVPASPTPPEVRKPGPSLRTKTPWPQIVRYAVIYGIFNAITFLPLNTGHGILLMVFFELVLGVISGVVLASILRRFKPQLARKSLRSIVRIWSLSVVAYLLLYWLTISIRNTLLDHHWLSLGLSPHVFVAVVSRAIAGAATGFILGLALQRSRRAAVVVGLVSFAVPGLIYHWFARTAHIDLSPVDFMFRFYIAILEAALFLWLIRNWGNLPSESSTARP